MVGSVCLKMIIFAKNIRVVVYPGDFEVKIGFNTIRERLKELCISYMGL